MNEQVVSNAAALCVLRDAVEMVPLLTGHYLRIGFGRVSFVDDGWTDGTFETLERIAAKTIRVSVTRVINDRFRQSSLASTAANALIDEGYTFVLPFDSDEFWHLSSSDIEELTQHDAPAQFVGKLIDFVQSRHISVPRRFSLLSARYRVGEGTKSNMSKVLKFETPWILNAGKKICFWSRDHVVLGYHKLKGNVGDRLERGFQIFHLPLRSKYELTKRGLNYAVRIDPGRRPRQSWQSRFHRRVVLSGRTDDVWAANSSDRAGRLPAYGRPIPLVRDTRLCRVFLMAATYMRLKFWHPAL